MRLVKPKPIYRSLTFWSGIFVMAFIGWVWRDSNQQVVDLRYRSWEVTNGYNTLEMNFRPSRFHSGFSNRVQNLRSGVAFRLFPLPSAGRGGGENSNTTEAKNGGHGRNWTWPEWVASRLRFERKDNLSLLVPHWLLLLAVAIPWFGLLFWRARRNHRANQSIPIR